MKEMIYLLAVLPMLVCAEQAPAQTSDGSVSEKAGVTDGVSSAERLSAYQRAGDFQHFADLIEATIRKYPPKYGEHVFAEEVGVGLGGDSWALNSRAWDVFLTCDDKAVLSEALSWSELSIRVARPITHPETEGYPSQSVDTMANLLYKLGRVDEAITAEQAEIARVNAERQKAGGARLHHGDGLIDNVEKMRKGEPTWPAK